MSYLFVLLISRSNYELFALSTRVFFFFIWCSINHYPLVNIFLFLFLISHHLSALKGIDNCKEKFLLGCQKEQKGFRTNLALKKYCVSLLPLFLEFLMMFQGDGLVISSDKNSWQKIVKLLNWNSWKNSWFYNLPRPESVLEESQTFDTLYPVSIRLMRVWLKKELGKLILNSLTQKNIQHQWNKLSAGSLWVKVKNRKKMKFISIHVFW